MVLLPSCLGFVCQEACQCRTFRKLSWSIFIILFKDGGPLLLFQPEATFFILYLEKLYQPGGETPLPFK
jgi:hypothetical protein